MGTNSKTLEPHTDIYLLTWITTLKWHRLDICLTILVLLSMNNMSSAIKSSKQTAYCIDIISYHWWYRINIFKIFVPKQTATSDIRMHILSLFGIFHWCVVYNIQHYFMKWTADDISPNYFLKPWWQIPMLSGCLWIKSIIDKIY